MVPATRDSTTIHLLKAPIENETEPKLVRCKVRRDNPGLYPTYSFEFQDGADQNNLKASMVAEKHTSLSRMMQPSKFYIFDVSRVGPSRRPLLKKSSNYLGKLKRDKGKRSTFHLYNSKDPCEQVGAFIYEVKGMMEKSIGGGEPRRMTAVLPKVDENTRQSKPSNSSWNHDLAQKWEENDGMADLMAFASKEPQFNGDYYSLDFGKRVTRGSNKNMQLIDAQGHMIYQFGRVGTDTFHLDYR